MIFVTVGAQMPFDRLVRGVDEWAASRSRRDVFAQIGPTKWRPSHIEWTQFIEPADFRRRVETASVIVAHAGMGSIITALEVGVPILVMPRRGHLAETRNDHQVATAERFLGMGRVAVAMDEKELPGKLDQLGSLAASGRIGTNASPELLAAVRQYIQQSSRPQAAARAAEGI